MQTSNISSNWSVFEKILFRFFFAYFGLYILLENNGAYPFWEFILIYPTEWLHTFVPWLGENVLHLSYEITIFTNGSGDTTYDYVITFLIFVFAFFTSVIWSVLDDRRLNYRTLYYWLTVGIRFYVSLMLINYGLVKVFKLQFPTPDLYRLTEIYGDSSPMGLAWTFLGFSNGYNLFMGIAEVLALLLLFRRTLTAGAIITLMTTANVMAVNYFYDVPVKILATHLVLMTLFLLLHNAKELLNFFFTGRQVQLGLIEAPKFQTRWVSVSGIVLKVLIIGYSLGYGAVQAAEMMKIYGDKAPKGEFYGLYNVDKFVYKTKTLPPLITDTIRWRQLVLESEMFANVRMMNDSISRYTLRIYRENNVMAFTDRNDERKRLDFVFAIPDEYHLQLKGLFEGDSVSIYFNKSKALASEFRLTKTGFHWINEHPYNR